MMPTLENLHAVWSKVLGISEIDPDADFFDIGGTSIQAAQIFSRVEEAYGVSLDIAVLLEASSLLSLHQHIASLGRDDPSLLVRLRDGDRASPLFLVHPVGGTVVVYRELVASLATGYAVYGIQASGLVDGQVVHRCVEEMADCYADLVDKAQPKGPIRIAGYSAGGVFAWATAQALVIMGREISFLGLINTHFSFRRIGQQVALGKRLKGYWYNLKEQGMAKFLVDLGSHRQHQKKLVAAEATLDRRGTTFSERREKLVEQFLQSPGPAGSNRYTSVSQVLQMVLKFYEPGIFAGNVVLFRSQDYAENRPGEIGWWRLVEGHLTTLSIPGSHLDLVEPPHVESLAKAMGSSPGFE